MILDYIALGALIIGALLVFYTFIFIHDLPHQVAKKRQHPHTDAIGVACWLSLLTLHAIWPIVFIWALTKQDRSLLSSSSTLIDSGESPIKDGEGSQLIDRVAALEQRLSELEQASGESNGNATEGKERKNG